MFIRRARCCALSASLFPLALALADEAVPRAAAVPDSADWRAALVESSTPGLEIQLDAATRVVLRLERFRVTRPGTRFVVGRSSGDAPLAFDPEEVVLLRGDAIGHARSHAFLAVSPRSAQGYVELSPGRRYAITRPAAAQSVDELSVAPVRMAGETLPPGVALCGVERETHAAPGGVGPRGPGQPGRRQIELAVNADYEYFTLFDGATEAADYVLALYGAISDIYIRDVNAHVTLSYVRIWDDPNDIYNDPDPLSQFREDWNTNMGSVTRDAAQLLSGRRDLPAGGVAWLNALCSDYGYSWAGYTLGYFYDPDAPHTFNRDIMVAGHELGHNCAALHTHDEGLDTCNVETSQPRRGTIMAYCGQTFTGGDANHDLWFHTVTQQSMEAFIQGSPCVAIDCNANNRADDEDIGLGASADLNANGVPDECEDCNGNSRLDPLDIALASSNDLNENGVPDECEPDCNGNLIPDDLDLLPSVGTPVFSDNFETDQGWSVVNLGATAGIWQRGIPVNDPGWAYDPVSDGDGSGRCWLTGNVAGNSDVDDGATQLVSPLLDMSAGGLGVEYTYYLRLTSATGVDRLLVEANNAGGAGAWVPIATHVSDTGGAWVRQVISASALAAAGFTPTATVRVRFTANDSNPQGVVEAGLDAFSLTTGALPPLSSDLNNNNVPDECEGDCDGDEQLDYAEIIANMSLDKNRNVVLDSCEDCDNDGQLDLVELDHAHNVWVASLDNTSLREYLSLYGTSTAATSGTSLAQAQDVLVTPDRRVLATSRTQNRVAEFSVHGAFVRDLVPPGGGGLSSPACMAISPAGTLLVADRTAGAVREYDLGSGAFIRVFATHTALVQPFGLAIGPNGNLFATASTNEVLEFDGASGAFVRVFVPAAANGGLTDPHGVVFLPTTGNLLVASYGSNQVLEYDGATGAFVRQFSRVGTATVMTLDEPWCLRIGPDGDVYCSRAHTGAGDGEGSGPAPLHLTNARIYHFDRDSGNFVRSFIMGVDSGILNPTGFDFVPDAGTDCNYNQSPDNCDIARGVSADVNGNGLPDECEVLPPPCPGDVNGDRSVNLTDLSILLANFGLTSGATLAMGDLDGDGDVDLSDLSRLLANFGSVCP